MTGKGHFAAGIIFSIYAFDFTNNLGGHALTSSLFCILGGNAPDYLEIRSKVYRDIKNPKRCTGTKTLIPHRTITHWLPIWMILFLFSVINIDPSFINLNIVQPFIISNESNTLSNILFSALLGYSIGGLVHLMVDLPNPMGIPILTPKKRFSLNLWRSGKMEPLILTVLLVFVLHSVGVINVNGEAINKISGFITNL